MPPNDFGQTVLFLRDEQLLAQEAQHVLPEQITQDILFVNENKVLISQKGKATREPTYPNVRPTTSTTDTLNPKKSHISFG
jgi:hypothetical protein